MSSAFAPNGIPAAYAESQAEGNSNASPAVTQDSNQGTAQGLGLLSTYRTQTPRELAPPAGSPIAHINCSVYAGHRQADGPATAPPAITMIPERTFVPPPKGFFAAGPNRSSSAESTPVSQAEAMLPSCVPSKGRRRESLGAQMRKGASGSHFHASTADTINAAAGARPIPTGAPGNRARSPSTVSRYGASPGVRLPSGGVGGDLSTSFGAAAETLSRSGPLLTTSITNGRYGTSVSSSGTTARPIPMSSASKKAMVSPGCTHTHFGVECTGPSILDANLPNLPPSQAALAQLKANSEAAAAAGKHLHHQQVGRRGSADTSASAMDDGSAASGTKAGNGEDVIYNGMSVDQLLHRCESCAKVYRHPSCLIKHRWEHTVYWKEASKFLLSKHQQVQLLEAAAILVGMDSQSRSLPEEKALWPAAVSPPSSGLLGSEVFNYERLMEGRRLRQQQQRDRGVSPSMSPLNNLSQLYLESSAPATAPATTNGFHQQQSATSPATVQAQQAQVQPQPNKPSHARTQGVTPALQTQPTGSAVGRKLPLSRDARAGSEETTPEEDLMEDVTRSSTTTTLGGHSSSHTSPSGTNADSPGRSTNSSGGGDQDDGDEDDDEYARDGQRYGMSSGGEVFAELDMD
ncbi:hypothetical protein K437DRAFT_266389 [Tilletiaria anomala UBC 951]|uniref:C2H2-type domain-containing protein n=1 Tax=Tilletiaria anomala (strain ATCC 24038 / CBS 436.72 / UBC 951) TaxID=1037660 RepID=A0A066WG06_TILAU|nr:uncharacterized protein K437DRAFT_266389 [Tilletiaria anomala UBC 951]KDN52726.1 hypothetical protein K437DRAFT_266389 [Tilletiaria anomala UBC 951]